MTYSQGGLIQAVDYNTFAQGGASVTHTTANINTVWGVGTGNKGYGQTSTLSTVGVETVTATQWATLIARLDSILTHQAGSGSGISAPTAGSNIAFLSTLSSKITDGMNNRLDANSNGSDASATGSSTYNYTTNTGTQSFTRTATFASADQARYFFNAGGKLIWNFSSTNQNSTSKSGDWVTLLGHIGTIIIGGQTNSRTGTGGTLNSSNTALGYWNAGTSAASILRLYSAAGTADYNNNDVQVKIHTNGVQGSNADVGQIVTLTVELTDTAADGFDDAVSVNVVTSLTVRPPETTNLADTWGSITAG